MKKPWQNHPTCTRESRGSVCGCPLTSRDLETWNPKTRLRCTGCGAEYEGTDREVARAQKADAALARRLDRQDRGIKAPRPRLMSFALTEPQLMDGSKDVTRRCGWEWLVEAVQSGPVRLTAVRKAMGLKKGESPVRLKTIEVYEARFEQLDAITPDEVRREGFPGVTPAEFVAFFCAANKCTPNTMVTRIAFRHVDADLALANATQLGLEVARAG